MVNRAGTYSDAARILSLTPSAVLQQIKSLESELEITLFEKNGKKLIPTRECEIISGYAGRIDNLCQRMNDELLTAHSRLKKLIIGVTSSVENSSLTNLLTNCRTDSDDVQITVVTDVAETLCGKLADFSVDLAIIDGEVPDNGFNSIILDTDRLVVAVPYDSPYAAQGMITPDQLKRERLILRPSGSGTRRLFEANLRSMGRSIDDFKVMMEVDNVATIKRLIAGGYGLSVLSYRACEKDAERKILATVPLCDMNMTRNIRIFYRRDFHNEQLLQRIRTLYSNIDFSED